MNYQQLKDFCNSLTPEQLTQEVFLSGEDQAYKVDGADISTEDQYFDHAEHIGNLKSIKDENPEGWETEIEDYTLVPKGTVSLVQY